MLNKQYVLLDDLAVHLESLAKDTTCPIHIAAEIDQILESVEPANVEEIIEGVWVYYSTTMMECSACQRHVPRHRYKRCPHCGAHMKGFDYECNS